MNAFGPSQLSINWSTFASPDLFEKLICVRYENKPFSVIKKWKFAVCITKFPSILWCIIFVSNVVEIFAFIFAGARFCEICQLIKPDRSHHCSMCNRYLLTHLHYILFKISFKRKSHRPNPWGITLCNNRECKLCRSYLQPVDSFVTSNGANWSIRSLVTCKRKNIVYFSSCNLC